MVVAALAVAAAVLVAVEILAVVVADVLALAESRNADQIETGLASVDVVPLSGFAGLVGCAHSLNVRSTYLYLILGRSDR